MRGRAVMAGLVWGCAMLVLGEARAQHPPGHEAPGHEAPEHEAPEHQAPEHEAPEHAPAPHGEQPPGHLPSERHTAAQPTHAAHEGLMTGVLGIPRSRAGSGTSWLPDSSPMYGVMAALGDGGMMVHGNLFAGYDHFSSVRGSDRFISTNWVMLMVWQPAGAGEVTGRVMLSAEPLTVGEGGYPLILQTGETLGGEPIVDRQHPHDLFMELAIAYDLALTRALAAQLYIAPVGEPALGPTAFPHRISAFSDPLSPLGHHWQDATHITFGVITAGLYNRHLKVEASWFNGREPDQERWDFDFRPLDSYAARISWNPGERWSLQGSYGFLDSPMALEPEMSVHRITASATYNRRLGTDANWATTLVVGENLDDPGPDTPAFLVESTWNVDRHHVIYGRVEYLRKAGHDLALPEGLADRVFDVGTVSAGTVYFFDPLASIAAGIGVRGSLGLVEEGLEPFYGQQFIPGAMVYLQFRPVAMEMAE